jgi:hypothetical protein
MNLIQRRDKAILAGPGVATEPAVSPQPDLPEDKETP